MKRLLLLLTLLLPTLLTAQESPAEEPDPILTLPTYDSAALAAALIYPAEALDKGEGGIIFVDILIDSTGWMAVHSFDGELPFRLAASEAMDVQKGFGAGLLNGKPINTRATIRIRFAYDKGMGATISTALMKAVHGDEVERQLTDHTYPEFIPNATKPRYDPSELQANIDYPKEAEKRGIQGMVMTQVRIDEEGNVVSAEVINTPDSLLIEPALAALWKTRFTPARQDGKPIKMGMMIPIRFVLNE